MSSKSSFKFGISLDNYTVILKSADFIGGENYEKNADGK